MNQDFSIITLVLHASFVVQLVMAGLLMTSLASWTVIFSKLFGLRRLRRGNDAFEQEFWSGKNLNDLFNSASSNAESSTMERIFACSVNWTRSRAMSAFWPASGRSARTWGCSARSGGSCMRLSGCPMCSR